MGCGSSTGNAGDKDANNSRTATRGDNTNSNGEGDTLPLEVDMEAHGVKSSYDPKALPRRSSIKLPAPGGEVPHGVGADAGATTSANGGDKTTTEKQSTGFKGKVGSDPSLVGSEDALTRSMAERSVSFADERRPTPPASSKGDESPSLAPNPLAGPSTSDEGQSTGPTNTAVQDSTAVDFSVQQEGEHNTTSSDAAEPTSGPSTADETLDAPPHPHQKRRVSFSEEDMKSGGTTTTAIPEGQPDPEEGCGSARNSPPPEPPHSPLQKAVPNHGLDTTPKQPGEAGSEFVHVDEAMASSKRSANCSSANLDTDPLPSALHHHHEGETKKAVSITDDEEIVNSEDVPAPGPDQEPASEHNSPPADQPLSPLKKSVPNHGLDTAPKEPGEAGSDFVHVDEATHKHHLDASGHEGNSPMPSALHHHHEGQPRKRGVSITDEETIVHSD